MYYYMFVCVPVGGCVNIFDVKTTKYFVKFYCKRFSSSIG